MTRLIFILFLGFLPLFSQELQEDFQKIPSRYGYEISRPCPVGFNYFMDFDDQTLDSLFYLSVSIQNDFLQFKLSAEKFLSIFQVSVLVRSEEKTILSQTWQEEYQLDDFEKTNSLRDFYKKTYMVNLKEQKINHFNPGEYEVLLEVSDLQSSIHYQNTRKMKIENKAKPYTEVVFKPLDSQESDIFEIVEMQEYIDFNTPYKAYVHLKEKFPALATVNVRLYSIEMEEQNLIDQTYIETTGAASPFIKIDYEIPYIKMKEGEYLLRFSLICDTLSLEIEKEFRVLWFFKPLYLYKLDLAVRPMKYLLDEEEMERVKKYDIKELENWFYSYWEKIDPTPETVYNELQQEFYSRVSEAVRDYSTRFKEGWQTDRGMIWILYGEPKEVENRKYSVSSIPHIIWKYDSDDGPYEFTFVDKEKNGNFVLIDQDSEQDN